MFVFGLPFMIGLSLTVPDCSRPEYEKYYVVTFVMSIVWISMITKFMVRTSSSPWYALCQAAQHERALLQTSNIPWKEHEPALRYGRVPKRRILSRTFSEGMVQNAFSHEFDVQNML